MRALFGTILVTLAAALLTPVGASRASAHPTRPELVRPEGSQGFVPTRDAPPAVEVEVELEDGEARAQAAIAHPAPGWCRTARPATLAPRRLEGPRRPRVTRDRHHHGARSPPA